LLDDELPGLSYLKMLCGQLPGLEVTKAYNTPLQLLQDAPLLDFDFCILDIEMPHVNGLQVANLLQGKPVIFTTAYKEYAVDAFDLNAVDYICKPIKKERLEQAVKKVAERLQSATGAKAYMQLNTNQGRSLIFFDDLLYIKAADPDSRDKEALLTDGTWLVLKNIAFDKLVVLLPSQQFCQVNKKELLAIRAVRSYTTDTIITSLPSSQPAQVTLSAVYRQRFTDLIAV
jgi:DNA-binding LytR/AlgR family response regulator